VDDIADRKIGSRQMSVSERQPMTSLGTLELPQQWSEAWQAAIKSLLRSDEKIVSWFEPNLTE